MIRILSYWFYCAALFVTVIVHLLSKITAETGGIISRYTPLLAALIIILGLYGFVFRRPFGIALYWKVTVWILVFVNLACVGFFTYLGYLHDAWFIHAGQWSAITFTLLFPAVIGLFHYAYRSDGIWQRGHQ